MKNVEITVNGKTFQVTGAKRQGTTITFAIDGIGYSVDVRPSPHTIALADSSSALARNSTEANSISAPMPGVVIAIPAKVGDQVTKGTTLVIIEAMKMENALVAPRDGVVAKIAVTIGDEVKPGQKLITLE